MATVVIVLYCLVCCRSVDVQDMVVGVAKISESLQSWTDAGEVQRTPDDSGDALSTR